MDDEKDQPDELPDNVIEFPRHRIVRWPKRFSREEMREGLQEVVRIVMELLRVG